MVIYWWYLIMWREIKRNLRILFVKSFRALSSCKPELYFESSSVQLLRKKCCRFFNAHWNCSMIWFQNFINISKQFDFLLLQKKFILRATIENYASSNFVRSHKIDITAFKKIQREYSIFLWFASLSVLL
jgi:hypothetical protein